MASTILSRRVYNLKSYVGCDPIVHTYSTNTSWTGAIYTGPYRTNASERIWHTQGLQAVELWPSFRMTSWKFYVKRKG